MDATTLKQRRPLAAAILSLLSPGLGHVYVGEVRKGFFIIGFFYAGILLSGFLSLVSALFGMA
jgi:signal peptidase I